jgi:chitin disaccharide deacetylase
MLSKALIINADDYGLTNSVSRGIRQGFRNGIITSTSVIALKGNFEKDIELLKAECPTIGIGVHLFVTSFRPLSRATKIPTLLKDGHSFFRLKELKEFEVSFSKEQLYSEWKSQIELIKKTGIKIDHIDSHHHVCYLNRTTVDVTADLCVEFNLPIRTPSSPNDNYKIVDYAKKRFKELKIFYPEYLITEYTKECGDFAVLINAISKLKNGVTEIITHSGFADKKLEEISSLVYSRESELDTLQNSQLNHIIKAQNIELSTFGSCFS